MPEVSITKALRLLFLWTILNGCSQIEISSNSKAISRADTDDALTKIKTAYKENNRLSVFEEIIRKNDIVLSACKEGMLAEFSPKEFDGLDGGFYTFINGSTGSVSDIFDQPTQCGPGVRVRIEN